MLLDNIKVGIRIRPFINRELEISDITTLLVQDQQTISTIPPIEAGIKQNQKTYKFDWVFDRMISQKEIFETTLEYQVLSVLDGINFTIMSYGASGSGKSHTLLKQAEDYGLLIRSINKIFQTIQSQKRQILIKFSYLEISQEQLFDLLNNMNTNLDIRDDQEKGVVIHGIKEIEIATTQELISLIQIAKKQKSLKQHEILIFSLYIQDNPQAQLVVSKLIFADLGWVERGAQKKKNISLQVLNNCISLLYEAKKKNIQTFIPYRNSKLTRLLKESLGGNSKTLIISCVSPAILGYEDTLQTLEYSQMATQITNQTSIKIFSQNEQQQILEQTNTDLINQNEELKKQLNKQVVKQKQNESIEMQQLENNIIQHFNKESQIYENIFKIQLELEQIRLKIKEKQQLLDQTEQTERKKYLQLRDEIQSEQEQVEIQENEIKKHQKQISDLIFQRKVFQDNIKQNDLVDVDKLYLTNLIEKYILKMQLQEIKSKELIYNLHSQEQEKMLSLQNSQITLRDRIIEEQRKQIAYNQKLNSTKRYTKSDANDQLMTNSKSKFKPNPVLSLPKVSEKYQEPYLYTSRQLQTPKLQTPIKNLRSNSKSKSKSKSTEKFKNKKPNRNIIDNLSTPSIRKSNALERATPSKLIDSKSMVSLPLIQSNRGVTKFVYDWKSGGYKFLEDSTILTSSRQIQQQQQKLIPNDSDKSFLINSSRGSSVQKNYVKSSLLLPGKINESLYVKGFINKEIEMKIKLHQLNLKMKKDSKKK